MVVLILEKVPVSLRGEITRWMLELKAGVFVGSMSALVRDKIWEKVCGNAKSGSCILAYKSNNEQGFELRLWGDASRDIIDLDGLKLVIIPKNVNA